jgi:perosamine synthetase
VTTPYTFAATAEVVRYLGAHPLFVDVDPLTLNIDVAELAAVVDRATAGDSTVLPPSLASSPPGRVAAVMPVDIAGQSCDRSGIEAVASAHGLAVVEDAAHSFPASHHGVQVGAPWQGVRSATCFSFYATKTITTGEGGMLVTDDGDLIDRARTMCLHGISKDAWNRYAAGGSWRYDIVAPGFKYNLTDIASSLGRAQLAKAERMRARRAEIASRYDEAFAGVDVLQTPTVAEGNVTSWHLYQLRLTTGDGLDSGRDAFIGHLTEAGIGTSVHFIPLHLHSYYRATYGYEPNAFPVATAEFEREISLPIYSQMSDTAVERVVAGVLSAAEMTS